MNSIHLQQTLGEVFADRNSVTSDVWHQDLFFRKGEMYLIEAASGTGKSSLCSYIYGYRNDYQGKAGKLSFGQQQRVAFIRALCQPFDFLFLDEPISHLDDDNSRIMGELIIAEAKAQGAGVIATSIGKHIELPYNHTLQL